MMKLRRERTVTPRMELQQAYMALWRTLGGLQSNIPVAQKMLANGAFPEAVRESIRKHLEASAPALDAAFSLLKSAYHEEFTPPARSHGQAD